MGPETWGSHVWRKLDAMGVTCLMKEPGGLCLYFVRETVTSRKRRVRDDGALWMSRMVAC